MSTTTRVWKVRSAVGLVEIELFPDGAGPRGDGGSGERDDGSVRELGWLVHAFRARDPEARRVVSEITRHLRGLGAASSSARFDAFFDVFDPRASGVADDLLAAARSGLIAARRLEARRVIIPLDSPSQDALGPASTDAAGPTSKSWVGIKLVDQDGAPVPNRPYRVILPDGTTRDGTLDSHGAAMIKDVDPGNCQIWCPYVEPRPETSYVVQPGDHVSGIAQSFGFDDYTTVWNDPGNADLQQQRTDPHVLVPGDSLTIPEIKAQPAANKPTSAQHPFQIDVSPLKLRLTLLDLAAKPMASAPVTVAGTALTTDGNGLVEATVDKSAKDATLDSGSSEIDLSLGGLNPSDDTSDAGYKARLYNMGFLWDASVDDAADEMLIALQDFQAQYKLTVSGQLDDATKGQLVQSYGC